VTKADVMTSCFHEQVQCPHGIPFPRELCQPYIDAANSVADVCGDYSQTGSNSWAEPGVNGINGGQSYTNWFTGYCAPLGYDKQWNVNPDFMLRCKCPPHRYGHACGMVKPKQCPNSRDYVWDGTFRNTLTPDKEHACFFRPTAEQSGLAGTIIASLRHTRINMTITNTSNKTALSTLRVEFYSRFRAHNDDPNRLSCPTWYSGIRTPAAKGWWYPSMLPKPVTCGHMLNNGSNPYWSDKYDKGCIEPVYADDTMAMYGVKQQTGVKIGDPGRPYTGPPTTAFTDGFTHECAGDVVNWLTCNLHDCQVQCMGFGGNSTNSTNDMSDGSEDPDTGTVLYTCPKALCTYEQPNYLNPSSSIMSNWLLLKTVLSAEGQSGKLVVTKLNHTNGTSALTTLEMDFPGKTDLTFKMQCMGGSCIKRSDMPPEMAELLKAEKIVNQPLSCAGYIPQNHGDSRFSSGSITTRLLITLICVGIFGICLLYGIFVFVEAFRLRRRLTQWQAEENWSDIQSQALESPGSLQNHVQTPSMEHTQNLEMWYPASLQDSGPNPLSQSDESAAMPPTTASYQRILTHNSEVSEQQYEVLHTSSNQELPVLGAPIGMVIKKVSYTVETIGKSRQIVAPISACIQPGSMVALMGPSGAGKSSLLDIVGGRNKVGTVSGSIWSFGPIYDNRGGMRESSKGVCYCMQHDYLLPTETVAETLMFASRIRGARVLQTETEIVDQVKRVLKLLQLQNVANSQVGSSLNGGGISGGERKRVSIGVELVSAPSMLVLDEPTTGLDSTSSQTILEVLRKIAAAGVSSVFSIHQPPLEEFARFNQVILMSRLGELLYTGSPSGTINYMKCLCENWSGGYPLPAEIEDYWGAIPTTPPWGFHGGNPAEHLLTIASIESDELLHHLHDYFLSDPDGWYTEQVLKPIESAIKYHRDGVLETAHDNPSCTSRWTGFNELMKRGTRFCVRNPSLLLTQVVVVCLIGCFFAVFTPDLALDFAGVQTRAYIFNFLVLFLAMCSTSSIGSIMSEKEVYTREWSANCYTPEAYLLSKAFVDFIPLRILPPMALTYICYWACGFRDDEQGLFGKFMLILSLGNCTSSALCLLISSLSSSTGRANLLSGAFIIYNFVFSGLLLIGAGDAALSIRHTSAFFYQWEALVAMELQSTGVSPGCRSFIFNPKIGGIDVFTPGQEPIVCTKAILENWHLHNRYEWDFWILMLFLIAELTLTMVVMRLSKFRK